MKQTQQVQITNEVFRVVTIAQRSKFLKRFYIQRESVFIHESALPIELWKLA